MEHRAAAAYRGVETLLAEAQKAKVEGLMFPGRHPGLGTPNWIILNRVSVSGYDPATRPHIFPVVVQAVVNPFRSVCFATPAQVMDAGTCSEVVAVRGWDSTANLAALPVLTVTLAASDVGAACHLSPDCSDAAVSLQNVQNE
ncbi:hypothetical protein D7X99_10900 [Corallococcus sp. AB032C]|uniref:hypothetical protein n=1 Tax=Corallococcus TaxID=83461 RepID=UPI000EDADD86|nr:MULTISPECIES: hypothetical protein [Corallococcus]NNB87406.1 hypothetical protein [Corallococcus exiguus]NPC48989.1 hypothetical protein [Corallococcus exiguus]RKH84050.1 hypothetical protein D7X99_10900 [Corallococcus sp. AB032C]